MAPGEDSDSTPLSAPASLERLMGGVLCPGNLSPLPSGVIPGRVAVPSALWVVQLDVVLVRRRRRRSGEGAWAADWSARLPVRPSVGSASQTVGRVRRERFKRGQSSLSGSKEFLACGYIYIWIDRWSLRSELARDSSGVKDRNVDGRGCSFLSSVTRVPGRTIERRGRYGSLENDYL